MNGLFAIISFISNRKHVFFYATDRLRTQYVEIHDKGMENSESALPTLSSPPSCCRDGISLKGGQKGVQKPVAKANFF